MKRTKPPTMADVARKARVSPMTVSRALRKNTSASEETRRIVLRAAEELGYVLDSTASGLSSRHSGFIAMTIPSINSMNFADTFRGLSEGLEDTGLDLLLGYTKYDIHEEERLVKSFLRRRPEAIVVTGGNHTDACRRYLANSGVPVIETWDLPREPVGDVVGFSNALAGELMAQHLYDEGCRKIGFIGGHTLRDTRGQDRRSGFLAGLKRLGLDANRIADTGTPPTTMTRAATAFTDFIAKYPDTDAVMCVSDTTAFGVMMECQRRAMRIPYDIAVAGFGADDVSANSVPQITTVDVDPHAIGLKASELIKGALHNEGFERSQVFDMKPKIIVRKSTKRDC